MNSHAAAVRFLPFLLFLAFPACAGQGATSTDPITSEARLGPRLPLIVKVDPGTRLYRNPMLALEILEVMADGKAVAGKESSTLFVGIDSSTEIAAANFYIYTIDAGRMWFWRIASNAEDPKLIEYAIPADAGTVEITYRFVGLDGNPVPQVYRLEASRGGQ